MGRLMIRCPETNQAILTGRFVAAEIFNSSAVFFSQTYCPRCNLFHEWFAKDAWICNGVSCERKLKSSARPRAPSLGLGTSPRS
jgi:hypothetical protein